MDIWRSLPPLAALRAFAAWADTGSMTAAGAALNVSHAAVSQQIRALETHLGLSLADRTTHPPRPTPEGARLAEALTGGFAAMARVIADLTGADAARPVQITTSPGFAQAWLLPRLARFRAQHPDVSLMLDPTPQLRVLAPGGIDVAMRYGRGDWPGLEARVLMPTPLVAVAAPALVRGISAGDMAALARLPWVDEMGTDDMLTMLDGQGLRPEGPVVSLPGGMKVDAVRAGHGIGVMSRLFVEQDIATGRLRELHRIETGKAYWLVHRPGPLRPQVKAFVRWILAEAGADRENPHAKPPT